MNFEDALMRARLHKMAIARKDKPYFLKLFEDGLYIGLFEKPDDPLKPLRFLRGPSIAADDWHIVEGR